jgi:hypothetical protein
MITVDEDQSGPKGSAPEKRFMSDDIVRELNKE